MQQILLASDPAYGLSGSASTTAFAWALALWLLPSLCLDSLVLLKTKPPPNVRIRTALHSLLTASVLIRQHEGRHLTRRAPAGCN